MASLPDRAEVLLRASALSEAGAHGRALALLDELVASGLDDAQLQCARGWALENFEPPRLADARIAYEAAIAFDGGALWARLGLATVLGQLGLADLGAAMDRDLVERATGRAAQEPEYLELLGWCQYRLGRWDEAAASFRRALAVDDDWVAVHFDLGLVLLLSGAAEPAAAHYGRGLRCLAARDAAARSGPLKVALDDLDEATRQHPAIAAASARLREQLLEARPAAADSHA